MPPPPAAGRRRFAAGKVGGSRHPGRSFYRTPGGRPSQGRARNMQRPRPAEAAGGTALPK